MRSHLLLLTLIFRLLFVCYVTLFIVCTTNNRSDTNNTYKKNLDVPCKNCNVSFWATKFTRHHIDGGLIRFKIAADTLMKRQRKGRTIVFINYDELYIQGLVIDQPLFSKIVKFDMNEINLLMALDANQSQDNNDNTPAVDQITKETETKVLGQSLSRVLVDQIKINFKPTRAHNKTIDLVANSASILTDTMDIRLQGNVSLNARKCKIYSQVAIWSNSYNGLFFSEPFQFNNKTYTGPAFFQITDTGKCQRDRSIQKVEYTDKLDVIEDEVFKSMPISVRTLFGLMGTSAGVMNLVN